MREVPMQCTVRMWDTYLAEGSSDGFSEFHVYVCAAFLAKWSKQLLKLDFQVRTYTHKSLSQYPLLGLTFVNCWN